jgi:4-hydroxybenzoate-CoA ligase
MTIKSESATYNAVNWLLDRNILEGRSDKVVFIDDTRHLTYGQLQKLSCRVANALLRMGVRREERVAMIALDTVDFPAIFLGAMRAGAIPVPLNTLLTTDQYEYILRDSRAKVLFISSELVEPVNVFADSVPSLERIIVIGSDGHGRRTLAEEVSDEPETFETIESHADEPAFWLYSSGSTGMPKGTRHVHSSLAATADTYGKGVLGIKEADVVLSAAKLFFSYGLGNSLTFPMSVGATSILSAERVTPERIFDLIERHQPTIFFGVPTLFASMLASTAKNSDLSSVRICVSAGEALPHAVAQHWTLRFGVEILDGVGSTELLHIFLSNRPGEVEYGTCGHPVPGYEVRLVDEAGNDVVDGELGEMLVKAPSAAEGYWHQRAKSRATFIGEWTRTGDKYLRSQSGRYVFCGRADEMFKVSGIWVSPFEVESALMSHPDVIEAAVIARADSDGLIKPQAFVVRRPDASEEALEESLKEYVKKSIGPWKYPRWIEFVAELPKTATGKTQRYKLGGVSRTKSH